MKKIASRLIILYGVICFSLFIFFYSRIHYQEIVISAPWYISNRNYVMALFFPKWEKLNQLNDPQANPSDKTPRWGEVLKTPRFASVGSDFAKDSQASKAREYVRQYVQNSAGIDHKKVESWLLAIIRFTNAGVLKNEEVFAEEPNFQQGVFEQQLQQVLTFIPLREHWRVFKENINLPMFLFCILLGVPQLFVYIVVAIMKRFIRSFKTELFSLRKKELSRFLVLSIFIGIFYTVLGIMSEYETAKLTNFVSGKWFFLQWGLMQGAIAMASSFLGMWSLKVFHNACRKEISLRLRLK